MPIFSSRNSTDALPEVLVAPTKKNNRRPLQELFARLRALGLSTPYVRDYLLPEWWDDDAALTPVGLEEATWTIARNLGIDAQSLRSSDAPLRVPMRANVQYKLPSGTTQEAVALARTLCGQVAKFVVLGTPPAKEELAGEAGVLRERILEAGASWVGFEELLDMSWRLGIAVLHVANFPRGVTKMDGIAIDFDGRRAIVLTSQKTQPAWLLFTLAHELGHIARGHLATGATLVDGEIDEGSTDPEEQEANEYAIQLLTGDARTRVVAGDTWLNASALASRSLALGRERAIDPGHLVLNYAHSMMGNSHSRNGNFWPVANAALKKLPDPIDAVAMIRDRLSANLDWSKLPDEAASFVMRMTTQDRETRMDALPRRRSPASEGDLTSPYHIGR